MNHISKHNKLRAFFIAFTLNVSLGSFYVFSQDSEPDLGSIVELEEVSVYSSAQATALEKKRMSNRIGSFVDSDEIGDLPDDTLGEALTRLSGVNVVGGTQVSIRGAEGKLNSIRVNGVSLAQSSTDASTSLGTDTRSFDVSTIPAEMVSSVEVIKSITADFDADSIGGMVNVETANAFDFDGRLIRYKGEYRYREQGDEPGFGLYATYADRIGSNGNVGIMLNFAYRDEDSRDWQLESRQENDPEPGAIPELGQFDIRERFTESETFTFNGSFDFKVGENTTLYLRPWINLRDRKQTRNRVRFRELDEREGNSRPGSGTQGVWWFFDENGNMLGEWEDNDGDGVLGSALDNWINARDSEGNIIIGPGKESSDARLERRTQFRPNRENNQYAIDFGGTTAGDRSTLEYRVNWSKEEHRFEETRIAFDTPGGNFGGFGQDFWRFRYDNSNPTQPLVEMFLVNADEGHIPAEPFVNRFTAFEHDYLDNVRFNINDFEDTQWVGQIDYSQKIGEKLELKIGGKVRYRERESIIDFEDWDTAGDFQVTASQFEQFFGPNLGAFDGVYSFAGPLVPAEPVADFFRQDIASTPGNWVRSDADEFLVLAARNYDIEETIYAGYIMGTYTINNLTLVGGVRVENTSQDVVWAASRINPPGTGLPTIDDVEGSNDYTNAFPSLVATYRINDKHVLRGAVTTTLARPDYEDIVPFRTAALREAFGDTFNSEVVDFPLGNPELSEQTSLNLDFAWEYYYGEGNNISVGFFYKDLDDFLFTSSFSQDILVPDDPTDPNSELNEQRVFSDFVANGSTQEIMGVEFSWVQSFRNILPSPFDGFGWVFNYTYVDGEQTEPVFDPDELEEGNFVQIDERTGQGLSNQPENIVNFQGYWEKWNINMRIAYNFVDELKLETFDVDFETKQASRETLDASLQYAVGKEKKMRFFMEVKNITEEPLTFTFQGNKAFPESFDELGRQWIFGIRGSL